MSNPNVFAPLNGRLREIAPRDAAESKRFGGRVAVRGGRVLTPQPYLAEKNLVMTNPTIPTVVRRRKPNGDVVRHVITYGREERKTDHIGTTVARPMMRWFDKQGNVRFTPYADAGSFIGEDLRLLYGIMVPGHLRDHKCWVATSVAATRVNENYATIEQLVHVGDDLNAMHVVAAIPGIKNLMPVTPLAGDTSRRVRMLARVGGTDVTYYEGQNLADAVREERILDLDGHRNLTGRLQPNPNYVEDDPHYHYGSNYSWMRDASGLILDAHSATRVALGDGNFALHYRGERFGYDTYYDELVSMGSTFTRDDFVADGWDAWPKPSNGGIHYEPVAYGAVGPGPEVTVGISDSQMGYGQTLWLPDWPDFYRRGPEQRPFISSVPALHQSPILGHLALAAA